MPKSKEPIVTIYTLPDGTKIKSESTPSKRYLMSFTPIGTVTNYIMPDEKPPESIRLKFRRSRSKSIAVPGLPYGK